MTDKTLDHRHLSLHIESKLATGSFYMGLTSAEGQKLEQQIVFIRTMKF